MRIRSEPVEAVYRASILALGGSHDEARIFAERLVLADLRGMDWQGVRSLDRHYVNDLRQGDIRLGQPVQVLEQGPSSVVLDAGGELGVSAGAISPLIAGIKCPPNSSIGDIFQLCMKQLEEPRCSSGRTG